MGQTLCETLLRPIRGNKERTLRQNLGMESSSM